MINVLILGGSGKLACRLSEEFDKKNLKVYSFSRNKVPVSNYYKDIIYSDYSFSNLKRTISIVNPDIIVNAAACTDIEVCQRRPEIAYKANIEIPYFLSEIIKSDEFSDIFVVHISTDHVYSNLGFTPENNTNCVNNYASSKLYGEIPLQKMGALILRTNYIGRSEQKNSYLDWVIESIKNNHNVLLYNNILFNPTEPANIAENIFYGFVEKVSGIYNIGSEGGWTKANIFLSLAERFNKKITYKLVDYPQTLISKPLDMRMDTSKATADGFSIISQNSLEMYIDQEFQNAI